MSVIRISHISAIDLHALPMAVPMPGLLTCGGIPSPSHQDECFECADRHHSSCVAKELWRPWADTLSSGMYQKGGGFVKVEAWAGGVRTGWVVGDVPPSVTLAIWLLLVCLHWVDPLPPRSLVWVLLGHAAGEHS